MPCFRRSPWPLVFAALLPSLPARAGDEARPAAPPFAAITPAVSGAANVLPPVYLQELSRSLLALESALPAPGTDAALDAGRWARGLAEPARTDAAWALLDALEDPRALAGLRRAVESSLESAPAGSRRGLLAALDRWAELTAAPESRQALSASLASARKALGDPPGAPDDPRWRGLFDGTAAGPASAVQAFQGRDSSLPRLTRRLRGREELEPEEELRLLKRAGLKARQAETLLSAARALRAAYRDGKLERPFTPAALLRLAERRAARPAEPFWEAFSANYGGVALDDARGQAAHGILDAWGLIDGRRRFGGKSLASALSPDGARIYLGFNDGAVEEWDVAEGRVLRRWKALRRFGVEQLQLSANGRRLFYANGHGVRALDLWTGRRSPELRLHGGWGLLLAPSPDGRRLYASARNLEAVETWDVETAKPARAFGELGASCRALLAGRDGKRLYAAAGDRIFVWDTASGRLLGTWATEDRFEHLAESPDGRVLYAGGSNRLAALDAKTGRSLKGFEAGRGATGSVLASADGRRLFSGHNGWTAMLDAPSGRLLRRFTDSGDAFNDIVGESPDGRYMIGRNSDSETFLLDTARASAPVPAAAPAQEEGAERVALSESAFLFPSTTTSAFLAALKLNRGLGHYTLLSGEAGVGKTALVLERARRSGARLATVDLRDGAAARGLLSAGSPLAAALEGGSEILLENIDLAPPGVLRALGQALAAGELGLRGGRIVKARPGFFVWATRRSGRPGPRGRAWRALEPLFSSLSIEWLHEAEEADLLARMSGLDGPLSAELVRSARALRAAGKGLTEEPLSIAALARAARALAAYPDEALGALVKANYDPSFPEADLRAMVRGTLASLGIDAPEPAGPASSTLALPVAHFEEAARWLAAALNAGFNAKTFVELLSGRLRETTLTQGRRHVAVFLGTLAGGAESPSRMIPPSAALAAAALCPEWWAVMRERLVEAEPKRGREVADRLQSLLMRFWRAARGRPSALARLGRALGAFLARAGAGDPDPVGRLRRLVAPVAPPAVVEASGKPDARASVGRIRRLAASLKGRLWFGFEPTFLDEELDRLFHRCAGFSSAYFEAHKDRRARLEAELKLELGAGTPAWRNPSAWNVGTDVGVVEVRPPKFRFGEIFPALARLYRAVARVGLVSWTEFGGAGGGGGHIHLDKGPFEDEPLLLRNLLADLHNRPYLGAVLHEAYDDKSAQSVHQRGERPALRAALALFDLEWRRENGRPSFAAALGALKSAERNSDVNLWNLPDGEPLTVELRLHRAQRSAEDARDLAELWVHRLAALSLSRGPLALRPLTEDDVRRLESPSVAKREFLKLVRESGLPRPERYARFVRARFPEPLRLGPPGRAAVEIRFARMLRSDSTSAALYEVKVNDPSIRELRLGRAKGAVRLVEAPELPGRPRLGWFAYPGRSGRVSVQGVPGVDSFELAAVRRAVDAFAPRP